MINTVLFDMGGTLEDIYIDDASKTASAAGVLRILQAHGIEPGLKFRRPSNSWRRAGTATRLTGGLQTGN